ncbi:unnamed protein product [Cunninghamella blakesleeana]
MEPSIDIEHDPRKSFNRLPKKTKIIRFFERVNQSIEDDENIDDATADINIKKNNFMLKTLLEKINDVDPSKIILENGHIKIEGIRKGDNGILTLLNGGPYKST